MPCSTPIFFPFKDSAVGSRLEPVLATIRVGELEILLVKFNLLTPFFRDRHIGKNGVDFAGLKRRDHPVEIIFDPNALGIQFCAECLAQIDIKSDQAAVRSLRFERRVTRINPESNDFPILGGNRGRPDNQRSEQESQDDDEPFHSGRFSQKSLGNKPQITQISGVAGVQELQNSRAEHFG